MMGLIFTELLESAERRYGLESLDEALASAETSTGGSYTAVANYDHRELVGILVRLSKVSGEPLEVVMRDFAGHLLEVLLLRPEAQIEGITGTFELLERLEPTIHATVRKLHPNAAPPHFDCERIDEQTLRVVYQSHRCLADFAAALIDASILRFEEPIEVQRRALATDEGQRHEFLLERRKSR